MPSKKKKVELLRDLHAEETSVAKLARPMDLAVLRRLDAGYDAGRFLGCDVVHGLLVASASVGSERQISRGHVVQRHT